MAFHCSLITVDDQKQWSNSHKIREHIFTNEFYNWYLSKINTYGKNKISDWEECCFIVVLNIKKIKDSSIIRKLK